MFNLVLMAAVYVYKAQRYTTLILSRHIGRSLIMSTLKMRDFGANLHVAEMSVYPTSQCSAGLREWTIRVIIAVGSSDTLREAWGGDN